MTDVVMMMIIMVVDMYYCWWVILFNYKESKTVEQNYKAGEKDAEVITPPKMLAFPLANAVSELDDLWTQLGLIALALKWGNIMPLRLGSSGKGLVVRMGMF